MKHFSSKSGAPEMSERIIAHLHNQAPGWKEKRGGGSDPGLLGRGEVVQTGPQEINSTALPQHIHHTTLPGGALSSVSKAEVAAAAAAATSCCSTIVSAAAAAQSSLLLLPHSRLYSSLLLLHSRLFLNVKCNNQTGLFSGHQLEILELCF